MFLTARWQIFIAGIAGGLLGEFLTLYEESRNDPAARKKRDRDGFYWIMSVLMALAGGGVALLYNFKEVNVFAVLNIGASAPVFLKTGIARFAPPKQDSIS